MKTHYSNDSSVLHEVVGVDDGLLMIWQKLKRGTQVGFPRLITVTPQKVTITVGRHKAVRHGHRCRWWPGQLGHDTDLQRRFLPPGRAIILEFNGEQIRRIALAIDPKFAPQCAAVLRRCQIAEQPPTWRRPARYLAWLIAPLFGLWAGVLSCLGLFLTLDEQITFERVELHLFCWILISIVGFGPMMIMTDRFYCPTFLEKLPLLVVSSVKLGWMTGVQVSFAHWLWDSLVALIILMIIMKLATADDPGHRLRQDPFPE